MVKRTADIGNVDPNRFTKLLENLKGRENVPSTQEIRKIAKTIGIKGFSYEDAKTVERSLQDFSGRADSVDPDQKVISAKYISPTAVHSIKSGEESPTRATPPEFPDLRDGKFELSYTEPVNKRVDGEWISGIKVQLEKDGVTYDLRAWRAEKSYDGFPEVTVCRGFEGEFGEYVITEESSVPGKRLGEILPPLKAAYESSEGKTGPLLQWMPEFFEQCADISNRYFWHGDPKKVEVPATNVKKPTYRLDEVHSRDIHHSAVLSFVERYRDDLRKASDKDIQRMASNLDQSIMLSGGTNFPTRSEIVEWLMTYRHYR